MKFWTIFLAVAIAMIGTGSKSQTYEQADAALKRGDQVEALAGFRKLAEQGDKYAQASAGLMYVNGQGVPKDARQAIWWFRQSAEQGSKVAQAALSGMYANGEGVPESFAYSGERDR